MSRLLALTFFFLAAANAASATDFSAMTTVERDAFRAEVKAYLLENPEVLVEAIDVLNKRQAEAEAASDVGMVQANKDAIFNDPASWVGGNPDGDITVVEFIDYRCGYCRKAYDEVGELVKSDGNIRFVVKEFPILGDASTVSARFAIAVLQTAGDEAYKSANDKLIKLKVDPTPEMLTKLATDLGLDPGPVLARMDSPEVESVIAANHDLGNKLKISGTPTFVINGTMLRGYVPLDGMRQVVEQERQG
ncbi:MAG: disulfide bond formation protein DsbA [Cereibacter sphaeroides]|uniref:Disulfide bond formation protein DsbA n=1 Tax=Cereibacter sphaeroides TaxID=1063 RepID=A0A2W5SBG6_CERSP|nr:MAG: disulfide bond formation protein DsbA [Cereibacter sphaeroides]